MIRTRLSCLDLWQPGADMKRVAFIEGKQKGEKLVGPISIEQDVGLLNSRLRARCKGFDSRPYSYAA